MATAATVAVGEAVAVAVGVAAGLAEPPQPVSTANKITQSRRSIVAPILCVLKTAVTVAIASLVAGCGGQGAASAPPPERAGPPLVVVGDSLAAGRFADTQEQAFPQQVAAAVHAQLEVLGVPGATTAQLAAQAVPG